ncbi:MAG TPA: SpoIIE family protein phosphatase [Flavobacteriales bacterium]|nr:SpoIIE family protein phosphatase [Flavobacteriales bacterium]HRN35954.1 SpoIIE family protein phosphatase [Flavobacteriales bacterium]HRO40591.1 SpoIIE family protein phosphatase [Flavobacteriales bacterium]HRP82600.1 SpoIIE family protein phosphatase [Flavobacteriales bacterium]HRQ85013.1 SpoIIE family protein phosphatase [Flavobacteriales bacterium]
MAHLQRLTERLNLKEFQLRALLDITKAINNNEPKEELLQLYADFIHKELGIERLKYFEQDGGWHCVLSQGDEGPALEAGVEAYMRDHREIEFIGSGDEQGVGRFDIAIPVLHRGLPLALLLIGDVDDDEDRRMSPTVKHLNFLQTITNLIAVAMENKRMAKQELVQERNRRELELAAEMQQMLVPRNLPNDAWMEAAAWYQPHHQVGGDFYDVVQTGPAERVLCVADVSGKGMAAALLMSNFQATLRATLQRNAGPLDRLVRELNTNVMERARGERFITCFIGRVNLETGTMEYVNAGHNPPLLATPGGEVLELMDGAIALGMLEQLPFVQTGHATVRGGLLLCYTDGLVEQENAQGEDFGAGSVRQVLDMLSKAPPSAVNDALMTTFENHRGTQPYLDDLALLTCRFK